VEADPELITWRQGRCLAYGDGVTLWALAEIVKAQAGIVEQDSPADVADKLASAAREALPEEDAGWVESHLLALAGLSAEAELGSNRRNEAFSAWRRFLEGLAEQRPVVLVFEDLHWADESLLDFVDELVDWITDVPLLVVATARPELLERRPNWGGGKLNAATIALAPLTDDQTAQLLGRALGTPVLAAETQMALLERAGGNPLYAEQFAELYVERGSTDELPLPETLQGIIAARLDGLSADEKSFMADGAVVGKVFWTAALGRTDADATATLHSLERKGFVRRQRRSSVEGQTELAFAHALVRDVAYGQIPRADRALKHRRVAEWIESLGRPQDHADMLAYHWSSALELARASGSEDGALADSARLALRSAGDRAFALNSFTVAAAQYEDALALWPDDDPERPALLFSRARALHWAYDEARQKGALESARDALLDAGDTDRAAEAEILLARMFWDRGQGEAVGEHTARAEELVRDTVSASSARVLATSARFLALAGKNEEALSTANAALVVAGDLGLEEIRAYALTTVGMAKRELGDPSGITDMEQGRDIALGIDSPIAATTVNNLAVYATIDGDLPRSEELYLEAARLAERYGDRSSARFIRGNFIWMDYMRGRWDTALASAEAFIAECEAGSPHTMEWMARTIRGSIFEGRGAHDRAVADHRRARELTREAGDSIQDEMAGALLAASLYAQGDIEQAAALLSEAIPTVRQYGAHGMLTNVAPYARELGLADELRAAVKASPHSKAWGRIIICQLDDDFVGAAELFAAMGNPTLEARQRLFAGERFIDRGAYAEGEAELEKALAFYRPVSATYFVAKAEAALARAQSASA
jgi:tetratricopeptide (TPR) repeat protein